MEPCEHDRCYSYETTKAIADERDGLRAQLKERDAIIDEAMRGWEALVRSLDEPPIDPDEDEDWELKYENWVAFKTANAEAASALRARIEEARR